MWLRLNWRVISELPISLNESLNPHFFNSWLEFSFPSILFRYDTNYLWWWRWLYTFKLQHQLSATTTTSMKFQVYIIAIQNHPCATHSSLPYLLFFFIQTCSFKYIVCAISLYSFPWFSSILFFSFSIFSSIFVIPHQFIILLFSQNKQFD